MKNRDQPEAPEDAARNEEELAAAAGRANLRVDVAKQNVRLAKEELKRARKRYKEAKREAKRARKRAEAVHKAWKQARRQRRVAPSSGSPERSEKPQKSRKSAAARGRAARSARRKDALPQSLTASSAAPRRG